jgi:hypothetical protein
MPFVSLGIVVPVGARYDRHDWRTQAATLVRAADLADHADQPATAVLAEGVAG